MREDQNEEAIRKSLNVGDNRDKSDNGKGKPKAKGAAAKSESEQADQIALSVQPKAKPQPKAKDGSKGQKGKGKGAEQKPKAEVPSSPPPKAKAAGPPAKAKPADGRDKTTVPCLFFPIQSTTKGESCWSPGKGKASRWTRQDNRTKSIRCKGPKHVAERVDDGVPIFKEVVQLHSNPFAKVRSMLQNVLMTESQSSKKLFNCIPILLQFQQRQLQVRQMTLGKSLGQLMDELPKLRMLIQKTLRKNLLIGCKGLSKSPKPQNT
eukprot:s1246_g8.t1